MTYEFLQHYWWFLIALLGGLLVFLMFVQGANSMIFQLGKTDVERRLVVNSTGRKWEFTFTTLVTFGGAFFASFPLFYSTSFGSAYWVWVAILFTFIIQAVSYEFQNKAGNLLGVKTFQTCLIINGIVGPLLIGGAVATFFTGSNFIVEKANIVNEMQPVISHWANGSRGLDVLLNPWVVVFGIAVVFLARVLGTLYIHNNVNDDAIRSRVRPQLLINTVFFLVFFLAFLVKTLLGEGYAVNAEGVIVMEPMKYLNNLLDMWYLAVILLIGVLMVLYGIVRTIMQPTFIKGIWSTGIGVVLVVIVLFLIAGWNNTAYYPSTADLQSSLTLQNSSSSEFTLTAMFYASLIAPFVLAYIFYAWRSIDSKKLDKAELGDDKHAY
ncbi:putative cytochrome d ubiquinol oxidase, subunit II [Prevotella disiens JCM 6334 = ATCC 29426]|jgi:putative cytochrome d ubiquinol oxidase, subunit II|uniref:Cytochrome C oxidase assembly protein n=4 Tax=Prevotella disiens TaxID=28130 RepID=A0A096AT25_9BACT|nr:cytochrome d ubiquinol oxidase subunit II [Prevotella disiens]EFL45389.1 putative cytochrome d ubiquinol oxidase, subunit II [Prevotella disiens FB035-09AN]ERJ71005.1 putative cytochrome d ubiquinol oxidase, subunit II [Prevotella disiens JCM 6334 = ATCC 29426]KGF49871.1 cytochrome C oxidase assembly protein [Prevotella disiens DNF00882]SUB97609.1 Cytochrome d ubiquinol oxidase subunit 2 [Prevotella disiens]